MDLPAAWAPHVKTMNNKNVLTAKGIGKVVKSGASDLVILRDIDLEITPGEAVAVIGASGSGKSTLLAILAGLDTPSAGRVEIDGDRKSTRLNSSHLVISYAVFCLKKKKEQCATSTVKSSTVAARIRPKPHSC